MATLCGNYSDYAGPTKVPGSSIALIDPRLRLLTALVPDLFLGKKCLDVGCNAGIVSCQLAFEFHAEAVVGVDIDPNLVAQARKLLALRTSRTRPAANGPDRIVDYFPISAVLTHGYRIEPERRGLSITTELLHSPYPRVQFHCADWVASMNQDVSAPFDVILALSVVKWIHLSGLDQGVLTFFQKCSSSLRPGGYLVIELQGWASYEKAVRVAPHFSGHIKELQLRPETSFVGLLAEQGLNLCASSEQLPRRIDIYRKADTSNSAAPKVQALSGHGTH